MRLTGFRGAGDVLFRWVLLSVCFGILALAITMVAQLTGASWMSIQKFGPGFLFGKTWDPVFENFGAFPFIYGTVLTSLVALLIAVPVGVGAAVYIAEYAPPKLKGILSLFVDLLAAIPSVVYGLWAIFELVPVMRSTIQPFLGRTLGFLPFFQGPSYGVGYLCASVVLAIMIVPFIISVTREVLYAIPSVYKEAAYALGSTRWEAIRSVLLSYGKIGIVGGVILALGRAIGETMAVTMVVGNNVAVSQSLFSPGYTLASVIANEFAEATGKLHLSALVQMGLVLLLVSAGVNLLARGWICWMQPRAIFNRSR